MTCAPSKPTLGRRAVLGAAVCGLGALLWPRRAEASLFRGVSLTDLSRVSELILVATPLEASSHWETLGGRRRIVTDTRVRVEDVLAKSIPAEGELIVRTLGGTVGDRAALVYGEAALFLNQTSVLFMVQSAGALRVTGMAQGHYPLLADASQTLRLTASPRAPELVGDAEPAMRVLAGQELGHARELIRAALGQ
jgi:hypothetical protein